MFMKGKRTLSVEHAIIIINIAKHAAVYERTRYNYQRIIVAYVLLL